MVPKPKQKFPDFFPHIRMSGSLSRSFPLSTATTRCPIDLSPNIMRQVNAKTLLELRVLIKIDVPPNDKSKLAPEMIVVRTDQVSRRLSVPRWVKIDGYYVHEIPFHLNFLKEFCAANQNLTVDLLLTIDVLDNPAASGVAELFLSRSVSTATMIKSVLAADPLPRSMIEDRQVNMRDAGIQYEIVSLKDPCLGTRMRTPVRFETCQHLECFDLHTFLKMEEKRPKGRCPVCNKLIEFRKLGVCLFTLEILTKHQDCLSYRLTPEGVEALSAEALAGESRKRKRGVLELHADNPDNQKSQPVPVSPHKSTRTNMKTSAQTLSEAPDYIVID